jgi:hypothetical protein
MFDGGHRGKGWEKDGRCHIYIYLLLLSLLLLYIYTYAIYVPYY